MVHKWLDFNLVAVYKCCTLLSAKLLKVRGDVKILEILNLFRKNVVCLTGKLGENLNVCNTCL